MKKKTETINKILCALLAVTFLSLSFKEAGVAAEPFESYSYNYWGDAVAEPYPYLYGATITPKGTAFSFAEDLFYYNDQIYVADTGNSRVLILDLEGNVEKEIKAAKNDDDSFNKPEGVFVTPEGHLYVADSANGRIVEFDESLKFIREITRPDTTLIAGNVEFKPTRVVVDKSGRIYTICYGINMGLVEFDKYGEFQGFMGAAEVNVSMFRYIWKNYFATDAQQLRMKTIIPTEYSNIFVDGENFIYSTISNLSENDHAAHKDAIRRLNPTGTDVLRRLSNNPIEGDLEWRDGGYSSFTDVAATEYGCYFVLDNANGKIFTYDYDGNNLFVFGKKGIREGNVQNPSSLVINADASSVYVLDMVLGSIIRFDITEYGENVLNALSLNSKGDSEGSNRAWREVLKANANCELAYIGLGKTYLDTGDYKAAMNYFKLGNSKKYYSKAFYYYRKELMESWFSRAMFIIGAVILIVLIIRGIKKFKIWKGKMKCFMENH